MSSNGLIHPDTNIASVALTISNLGLSLAFYQDVLGFQLHRQVERTTYLGAGKADLVELIEEPAATHPGRTTGLYHMAIRVPSPLELARTLRRLVEGNWPLQGFADHGVSQAIYLADPDGNGIEVYRDYPRQQWRYQNGQLSMSTDPLDVDGLLAELRKEPGEARHLPPETDMGHVHLRVADIPGSEQFYCKVLGFELIQRYGSSASFVAAGGYHHHIGMNTWGSHGAPPPPPGALGLHRFTIHTPNQTELTRMANRIQAADIMTSEEDRGIFLRDPAGNGILLTANGSGQT